MDSVTATDAAAAANVTGPRVTLESIQRAIADVEYHHPEVCPHMTVAYVQMRNGFIVIGKSAPADPANFNPDLGRQFAREDAIRQIWQLEGYALRERLSQQQALQADDGRQRVAFPNAGAQIPGPTTDVEDDGA